MGKSGKLKSKIIFLLGRFYSFGKPK